MDLLGHVAIGQDHELRDGVMNLRFVFAGYGQRYTCMQSDTNTQKRSATERWVENVNGVQLYPQEEQRRYIIAIKSSKKRVST